MSYTGKNVPQLILNHRSPYFILLCLSVIRMCVLFGAEVLLRDPPFAYTSDDKVLFSQIFI